MKDLKFPWISVNDRLPDSTKGVLCIDKNGIKFIGNYTKGHEIEYWDDDYDGPYDEVEDKNGVLYLKPGWYESEEQVNSEYDEFWLERIPTHWMPLDTLPEMYAVLKQAKEALECILSDSQHHANIEAANRALETINKLGL